MSERINIEAILKKNIAITYDKVMSKDTKNNLKAAIKEIVELAIDKAANNAELETISSTYMWKDGTQQVDKRSILQVKQLIDYE